jgi:hypothetical protein
VRLTRDQRRAADGSYGRCSSGANTSSTSPVRFGGSSPSTS